MTQPKPRPTIAEMVRNQPNLGAPVTDRVIRLSANEGAFGPSPKALVAMAVSYTHLTLPTSDLV